MRGDIQNRSNDQTADHADQHAKHGPGDPLQGSPYVFHLFLHEPMAALEFIDLGVQVLVVLLRLLRHGRKKTNRLVLLTRSHVKALFNQLPPIVLTIHHRVDSQAKLLDEVLQLTANLLRQVVQLEVDHVDLGIDLVNTAHDIDTSSLLLSGDILRAHSASTVRSSTSGATGLMSTL